MNTLLSPEETHSLYNKIEAIDNFPDLKQAAEEVKNMLLLLTVKCFDVTKPELSTKDIVAWENLNESKQFLEKAIHSINLKIK